MRIQQHDDMRVLNIIKKQFQISMNKFGCKQKHCYSCNTYRFAWQRGFVERERFFNFFKAPGIELLLVKIRIL